MTPRNLNPIDPVFAAERHLDLQADLHHFADGLFEGKTILDVGAGLGHSKTRMARSRVTTHDVSEHVRGFVDVVAPLPPAGPFDVVTAFEVLEHVEDDVAFLRMLNERATQAIFLTTPNGTGKVVTSHHHFREYDHSELLAVLGAAELPLDRASFGAYTKDVAGGRCDFLPFEAWGRHVGLKHLVLIDKGLSRADRAVLQPGRRR